MNCCKPGRAAEACLKSATSGVRVRARSCMNIAGFGCGVVLDFFRVKLRHGFNIASLPADSLLNDGSRLLLACARPSCAPATS